MVRIAYSPIYKYNLPEGHRFPMEKYSLLPEQLLYQGIVEESVFFYPEPLKDEEILLTHTKEYLEKLNGNSLSKKEARAIGFPIRPELIWRGKHISNGTYQCAKYALKEGAALNIAGGTHHAFADRGEGFCIFNDFAIAANLLLHRGEVKKILIIDLDVHQGNGNAKIFNGDSRVFTFSVHGAKNYPLKKEKSDLDVGVPNGIEDKDYLRLIERYVPQLVEAVEPELIFYLAGVDVLETDKLGRLKLTKEGCRKRDQIVFEAARKNDVPIAVSMGGGYSHRISDIVDAHANTFRMAMENFG
jgi:acetoin utilization deacetylase AcuC-like enzyme